MLIVPAAPSSSAEWCLDFEEGSGQHVNHGKFHKQSPTDYGACAYQAWVKAGAGSAYVFSTGYGGHHEMLFGFGAVGATLSLFGNVSDGTTITSFGSFQPFPAGQWRHIFVGYDGTSQIVTCLDGVPVGRTAYTSRRKTIGAGSEGVLYIMGSDHSNAWGRVKGYMVDEDLCPYTLGSVFRPQRVFRNANRLDNEDTILHPSLLIDCSGPPSEQLVDHSNGFEGQNHCGVLSVTVGAGTLGDHRAGWHELYRLPRWVRERLTRPAPTAAAAVPGGALFFDSFGGLDVTLAWQEALGLGTTEFGGATWQNASTYGKLLGRAYNSAQNFAPAYIPTGMADHRVDVKRVDVSAYKTGDHVANVRVQDASNHYRVIVDASNQLYLQSFIAGAGTTLQTGAFPANWTTLRVVAQGTTLSAYADAEGSPRATATMGSFLTAQGAGFTLNDSLLRVEEFAVYAAA